MPLIPDAATIQKSFAMLPVSTYEPGEMVIAAGATTGKLLFLRQGEVEVVRDGTQILNLARYSATWPFCWISHIQLTCGPSNIRSLMSPMQQLCLQAIRRPRFISRQSLPVALTPPIARSLISSGSSKPASLEPRSPER
jgi:CRP-like cAMP-binding protein